MDRIIVFLIAFAMFSALTKQPKADAEPAPKPPVVEPKPEPKPQPKDTGSPVGQPEAIETPAVESPEPIEQTVQFLPPPQAKPQQVQQPTCRMVKVGRRWYYTCN